MIDAEVDGIGHVIKIKAVGEIQSYFDRMGLDLTEKGIPAQGRNHADGITQQQKIFGNITSHAAERGFHIPRIGVFLNQKRIRSCGNVNIAAADNGNLILHGNRTPSKF